MDPTPQRNSLVLSGAKFPISMCTAHLGGDEHQDIHSGRQISSMVPTPRNISLIVSQLVKLVIDLFASENS